MGHLSPQYIQEVPIASQGAEAHRPETPRSNSRKNLGSASSPNSAPLTHLTRRGSTSLCCLYSVTA